MKITVILCTYNRSATLAEALSSVSASILPESVAWDVLVIDNNSSDQTREVAEGFCRKFPGRFKYMHEPKQGKSHALNSGIKEAQGDVLAFMDDDVVVEPTWLQNLTKALNDERWAGTGGRILPVWHCPPPPWLPIGMRYALAPLAEFDLGPNASQLDEPPFGTNMAFRKVLFAKYGGFRTDLGPRPGSEGRNEDTEFGSRLLTGGERLFYEPSAVVHHPIADKRLTKKYFMAWNFEKAGADIREHGLPAGTKWFVAGIPLYMFRRLAVWTVRWLVTFNSGARFSCKLKAWGVVGQMLECHRQSVEAKTAKPGESNA